MVEPPAPSPTREGAVCLLFAHHGTEGARRAEPLALDLAKKSHARILHLLVVPEFWREMMGDDWLNNASTRQVFGSYLENLLSREVMTHLQALQTRCQEWQLEYEAQVRVGDPTTCLLELARTSQPILVVVGPRRPRGVPGLRCRLQIDTLLQGLTAPLVIAPWGA